MKISLMNRTVRSTPQKRMMNEAEVLKAPFKMSRAEFRCAAINRAYVLYSNDKSVDNMRAIIDAAGHIVLLQMPVEAHVAFLDKLMTDALEFLDEYSTVSLEDEQDEKHMLQELYTLLMGSCVDYNAELKERVERELNGRA
jgi:hypothetical protein